MGLEVTFAEVGFGACGAYEWALCRGSAHSLGYVNLVVAHLAGMRSFVFG